MIHVVVALSSLHLSLVFALMFLEGLVSPFRPSLIFWDGIIYTAYTYNVISSHHHPNGAFDRKIRCGSYIVLTTFFISFNFFSSSHSRQMCILWPKPLTHIYYYYYCIHINTYSSYRWWYMHMFILRSQVSSIENIDSLTFWSHFSLFLKFYANRD